MLKNWLQGPTSGSDNPKKLNGKIAVITGATSGIGKEVALDLAARGAKVLILCRDKNKAEKMVKESKNGQNFVVHQMDLASMVSVKKCAQEILKQEGKIDYLVNNAGVMMCPYEKTVDGFEMQLATNHLGHFLLDDLLMPLVKKGGKNNDRQGQYRISCAGNLF